MIICKVEKEILMKLNNLRPFFKISLQTEIHAGSFYKLTCFYSLILLFFSFSFTLYPNDLLSFKLKSEIKFHCKIFEFAEIPDIIEKRLEKSPTEIRSLCSRDCSPEGHLLNLFSVSGEAFPAHPANF